MLCHLPIGLLSSNCYVLYDPAAGTALVIDPGFTEADALLSQLETLNVRVTALLNTHGHFDHVSGNALLQHLGAPLGIHPQDRDLLLRGGGAAWFGLAYPPSPEPDFELEHGSTLTCGSLTVEVIHTPGHSPGSVCLYVPQEKLLLTGDTLFAGGGVGRTDLPGGDPRALTRSLQRLLSLPHDTRIYPGHGPAGTLEHEARTSPWLRRIAHGAP